MARPPIPYDVAVRVYFRDGWLCSHCRRPTVFHLTLKLLAERVAQAFPHVPLAYWDERWRRDQSPLLDQLAALIDHVNAFSKGGEHAEANFATICVKCTSEKARALGRAHGSRFAPPREGQVWRADRLGRSRVHLCDARAREQASADGSRERLAGPVWMGGCLGRRRSFDALCAMRKRRVGALWALFSDSIWRDRVSGRTPTI